MKAYHMFLMVAIMGCSAGCSGSVEAPDDAGTDAVPPWCYEVPGAQGCPHLGCTEANDAGEIVPVPCP